MSMLAEPKRKQKFGPDPRNTQWSNDESKFGFRMLESMGWKKGKGLGAKESGMTEHIRADHRKNTDVRGLGCSKKHADNWIAHQDDFSAILASLNKTPDQPEAASESSETAPAKASLSLEKKSQTSRSRVHYHKFTRGKDLASRSDHDLDCIFGRRKDRESAEKPDPELDTSTDKDESSDDQNNNTSNNLDKDVHSHGVKTITSTSSVQEYFAMKMAALKQKRETSISNGFVDMNGRDSEISSNNKNKVAESTGDVENMKNGELSGDGTEMATNEDSVVVEKRKSKKKKKKKDRCEDQENSVGCEELSTSDFPQDVLDDSSLGSNVSCENQVRSKSKKKQKRKKSADSSDCALDNSSSSGSVEESTSESQLNQENESSGKKAKKRKSSERDLSDLSLQENSEIMDQNGTDQDSLEEPQKKKKKKKKQKQEEGEAEKTGLNSSILRQDSDSKSRRRKSVRFSTGDVEVFMIPNKEDLKMQQETEEPSDKKLSKKRKRQKEDAEGETPTADQNQATVTLAAKNVNTETKKCQSVEEEEDSVPRKKKRKSEKEGKAKGKEKSESLKENAETEETQPVESSPARSPQPDSAAETVNDKGENSSLPFEKAKCRRKKKVSQDVLDRICKLYVNSNISSIKGYDYENNP